MKHDNPVLKKWREGLDGLCFLYRDREGCLWGIPKRAAWWTPEEDIQREPLNVRAWLNAQLGDIYHAADDFNPSEAKSRRWLAVRGAIEALIIESTDRVLAQARQRFEGYGFEESMPKEDEFYPRSWMQLQDRTGTCTWLQGPQRQDTEKFLASVKEPLPKVVGGWVKVKR